MTTNPKSPKTTTPKAKAKRVAKRAAKPTAPHSATAQSAPALGLTEDDLNDRERRVLAFLRNAKLVSDAACTAGDLARGVFGYKRPLTTAKSWARNALRRLVREGFVRQVGGAKAASGLRMPGDGTYKATTKGVAKNVISTKATKAKTITTEAASDDVAAE